MASRRASGPRRRWWELGPPWRSVLVYGALLAAGVLALQWIDYRRMALRQAGDIYTALLAGAFLALGVVVGARAIAPPKVAPAQGNPEVVKTLGISGRELTVLHELAAGRSNKEIAQRLGVSPNTVKTHVARLYEKLEARRRTEAVNRARELGILS